MLNRSANTATYAEDVAKIEISFPDDFLPQIDDAAARVGESRDDFLRRSVEDEVARNQTRLRKELEELIGPARPRGGNAAEIIREMRDKHPPIRRGNVDAE
jgi:hypothetical protein